MAAEGLGRQPVELGQPGGAPAGRLVVVSDAGEDDDPGLDGLGIAAGLGRFAPQGRQSGPYSSGARNRGTQPSPTAAARRRAAALEPPNHSGTGADGRLLHVSAARSGPAQAAPQPGHALVHELAPAVVVDAGPLVLVLVDAHAEPEDEAPAREELERSGLLGHGGRTAQGELQHAGPEGRPGHRGGGHGERGHRLADGVGPVEVVDGPQRVGPGRLGPSAELGQRRGTRRYYPGYYRPSKGVLPAWWRGG